MKKGLLTSFKEEKDDGLRDYSNGGSIINPYLLKSALESSKDGTNIKLKNKKHIKIWKNKLVLVVPCYKKWNF